ncbi:MAG: ABC-type transport system involved in Fe-S cluster assembly fused permease/ATPase subunit [Gammaproteobacteria bacterium]|jgi:ABC-type transport system involved in Fe-S cluster assembly fused permease/ATPase subunit
MRPRESYDQSGPRSLGNLGTLRRLFGYLWPSDAPELRVRVVLALVCLFAAKVAVVFVPVFYKDAVDALTGDSLSGVAALPVGIVLSYGAARVLSLAFGELRDAVFARVGQRAIRSVALEVFRHLHAMSLRFHVDRQTGGLSRTISRGVSAIEVLLRFSLFNIIPTLVEILLVFFILWATLDIYIALVTITTVIVYIAYTMAVTEWRIKFRRQMNESDNQANTKAVDSLLNFETVKYFGNEEHEAQRYDLALRSYENAAIKSSQSLALLNVGQALVISVGLTVVMLMTGNAIVAGTMTIGGFVMANTYLMQLYQPLGFFGFVYREIKQSLIDIEKMLDLLDVEHEVADAPDAHPLSLAGASVRFENVNFSYDARRPILKNVSFEVPAGKTVAFVGASGAGKSTISRLLYRFYDVGSGRVSIDGQDVREVTQASLRAAVGIVPQDTVLFNDTIYYNISYGRPAASPSEVEDAARLAQIHDFIMSLPDGYQSTVGERGLKLSGGEKQRVAIARTIIKNPAVLVLDEATSALDSRTEQAIQAKLRELSRGRTTLSIAHRLSTVVDADEILVMQHGTIVERGDHLALLARDGLYTKMWQRQQEGSDEILDDDAIESTETL